MSSESLANVVVGAEFRNLGICDVFIDYEVSVSRVVHVVNHEHILRHEELSLLERCCLKQLYETLCFDLPEIVHVLLSSVLEGVLFLDLEERVFPEHHSHLVDLALLSVVVEQLHRISLQVLLFYHEFVFNEHLHFVVGRESQIVVG